MTGRVVMRTRIILLDIILAAKGAMRSTTTRLQRKGQKPSKEQSFLTSQAQQSSRRRVHPIVRPLRRHHRVRDVTLSLLTSSLLVPVLQFPPQKETQASEHEHHQHAERPSLHALLAPQLRHSLLALIHVSLHVPRARPRAQNLFPLIVQFRQNVLPRLRRLLRRPRRLYQPLLVHRRSLDAVHGRLTPRPLGIVPQERVPFAIRHADREVLGVPSRVRPPPIALGRRPAPTALDREPFALVTRAFARLDVPSRARLAPSSRVPRVDRWRPTVWCWTVVWED